MTTKVRVDITIENHGSIFLFRPHTRAAREWIDENVQAEPWQWVGGALAVEHRYARDLAEGMVGDGLNVGDDDGGTDDGDE